MYYDLANDIVKINLIKTRYYIYQLCGICSIEVINAHLIPRHIRIILFFKDISKSFRLIMILIMNLVNFHHVLLVNNRL